jgi:hypothetical protein
MAESYKTVITIEELRKSLDKLPEIHKHKDDISNLLDMPMSRARADRVVPGLSNLTASISNYEELITTGKWKKHDIEHTIYYDPILEKFYIITRDYSSKKVDGEYPQIIVEYDEYEEMEEGDGADSFTWRNNKPSSMSSIVESMRYVLDVMKNSRASLLHSAAPYY